MKHDGIGSVMQVAYVVESIDDAMRHWQRLGAGPFYVMRRPQYRLHTFMGQPVECHFSAAFAMSGDLQIELIQQHDAAPTSFRAFIDRYGHGVQHFGVLSHDMKADTARLVAQGGRPVHRMVSTLDVETLIFDVGLPGGAYLELIEAKPVVVDGLAAIKAAASQWDGTGPSIIEI